MGSCTHQNQSQEKIEHPNNPICEDCAKIGGKWVSLRQCTTCGHISCCNSSTHQHARKHSEKTGHPIAQSLGSPISFRWCYIDNTYVDWKTNHKSTHRVLISFGLLTGVIAVALLFYVGASSISSDDIPFENIKCWHKNAYSQIQDVAWKLNSEGVCEAYSTMPGPNTAF